MTLILSCLTRDYAVQVSDRLLTADGREYDPAANKGVAFKGLYAVGYAGLARLENLPTDTWLAMALASTGTDDPFMDLGNFAEQAIRTSAVARKLQGVAFVAVGWKPKGAGFVPSINTVTNAARPDGRWEFYPDGKFNVNELDYRGDRLTDKHSMHLDHLGASVPPTVKRRAFRNARNAMTREAGAVAVARVLGEAVRSVADRDNTVGKDLLVVIVPRPEVAPHESVTAFPPEARGRAESYMSFYLMPEGSDELNWTMPCYAKDGWAFTDTTWKSRGPQDFTVTTCVRRRNGAVGYGYFTVGDMAGGAVLVRVDAAGAIETLIRKPGEPFQLVGRTEPRNAS